MTADGPIPPSYPNNTGTSSHPDGATRPRLSSSYDEPEVILKERKPKLTVDIPADDSTKPVYHELEDEQRSQENESVADNSKSPTENTVRQSVIDSVIESTVICIVTLPTDSKQLVISC